MIYVVVVIYYPLLWTACVKVDFGMMKIMLVVAAVILVTTVIL